MTLEHAVFYELETALFNACSLTEFNKSINSIFDFNVLRFLWSNTFRGTFFNVNDFLQSKFFEYNLYT
jgi:hypothetical protein